MHMTRKVNPIIVCLLSVCTSHSETCVTVRWWWEGGDQVFVY